MQFPAALEVQLVQPDGQPLAEENVLVYIEFYLDGAQRYLFVAGLTDARGRLQLLPTALEEQLSFNRNASPETFETSLEECDETISLLVAPGEFIDDMAELLGNAPDSPEAAAALSMYRAANTRRLSPARVVYNLTDVPKTDRARLMLAVETAEAQAS